MIIDGIEVTPEQGASILATAGAEGIEIPNLCSADGIEPYNSCMLCMVEVDGGLVPACSHPANPAGEVRTSGTRIAAARARVLELLITEHRGDCEAPCSRLCPSGMDIPEMIRLIETGNCAEALLLARRAVVLPGVMGRICPAPCERVCRRKGYDSTVAIRQLESYIAQSAPGSAEPPVASAGQRDPAAVPSVLVAVVGAGPSGLSAAVFAAAAGHRVTVFDSGDLPGGALRTHVDREKLPEEVLEADVEAITALGVGYEMKCEVGRNVSVEELASRFDAVVVAAETASPTAGQIAGSHKVVYAEKARAGSAASRQAITAVRYGRAAARAALQSATNSQAGRAPFDSYYGVFTAEELELFVSTSGAETSRRKDATAVQQAPDAGGEAKRCLGCDCAAKQECRLRKYATRYLERPKRYRGIEKPRFSRLAGGTGITYEESKCIRCGLCVRITEAENITPGFGFIARGYALRVRPPFGEDPGKALGKAAARCVQACPTGALYFAHRDMRGEDS